MTTNQRVATTILEQLGGRRFIAMTGANSFASGDSMLTFKLPSRSTKNNIRGVRVTLTPADDYTVEFLKMRGFEVVTVSKSEGIYADMLQEVFTEATGLYTRL